MSIARKPSSNVRVLHKVLSKHRPFRSRSEGLDGSRREWKEIGSEFGV